MIYIVGKPIRIPFLSYAVRFSTTNSRVTIIRNVVQETSSVAPLLKNGRSHHRKHVFHEIKKISDKGPSSYKDFYDHGPLRDFCGNGKWKSASVCTQIGFLNAICKYEGWKVKLKSAKFYFSQARFILFDLFQQVDFLYIV